MLGCTHTSPPHFDMDFSAVVKLEDYLTIYTLVSNHNASGCKRFTIAFEMQLSSALRKTSKFLSVKGQNPVSPKYVQHETRQSASVVHSM